jgi:UDP-3-O-acyl N-acetylglucosamine deacetylase
MIHLPRYQQTIIRPVRLDGFGFWSGRDIAMEFRPAPPDTGIVFVRHDLKPPTRIPALAEHRIDSPRRTTLASLRATVEMVEHTLAALAGLNIDNCEVWVDDAEMPGLDGSSLPIASALAQAGTAQQPARRRTMVIAQLTRVGSQDAWIEARPSDRPGLSIEYELDFSGAGIGRQRFQALLSPAVFMRQIAPARTFLLKKEAQWLQSQGLAQRVTYQDVLVFDDTGLVDNHLRFQDECVRHKILDLIGDLALAGCDLHGSLVAHRSGHQLNAELVQALAEVNPISSAYEPFAPRHAQSA